MDRTFRKIRKNDSPFGGVTMVFSGDWRQCKYLFIMIQTYLNKLCVLLFIFTGLPVLQKASRAQITEQTLKHSYLWNKVKSFKLKKNMRLESADVKCREFAELLLEIGEGRREFIDDSMIEIPDHLRFRTKEAKDYTTENFCDYIFQNLNQHVQNLYSTSRLKKAMSAKWLLSRAIICPTNSDCDDINRLLMKKLRGDAKIFRSFDKILKVDQEHNFPTEFLNSREHSSMPSHIMELKVGAPIMLLRNLDPKVRCFQKLLNFD